jgi:hypothetical protein
MNIAKSFDALYRLHLQSFGTAAATSSPPPPSKPSTTTKEVQPTTKKTSNSNSNPMDRYAILAALKKHLTDLDVLVAAVSEGSRVRVSETYVESSRRAIERALMDVFGDVAVLRRRRILKDENPKCSDDDARKDERAEMQRVFMSVVECLAGLVGEVRERIEEMSDSDLGVEKKSSGATREGEMKRSRMSGNELRSAEILEPMVFLFNLALSFY